MSKEHIIKPIRFIHYSNKPLVKVDSVPPSEQDSFKPRGLWFSVEGPNDWKSWCLSKSFRIDNLTYSHQIILDGEANIFKISNAKDFTTFTSRYSLDMYNVRWSEVAKEYDGIVIAPYIWECRFDIGKLYTWYHAWDCASGCIWNANVVKEIVPLPQDAILNHERCDQVSA